MAELRDYAATYNHQMAVLDAERDKLRAERDRRIRAAYRQGMGTAALGEIFGVSQAHVSRIVRSTA